MAVCGFLVVFSIAPQPVQTLTFQKELRIQSHLYSGCSPVSAVGTRYLDFLFLFRILP